MKQIDKSAFVLEKLRAAEVNPDEVAVFEAIALNTRPVRKKHPIFKDAVANRALLEEMAQSVNSESRPLQMMHDSSVLPAGRVVYGEVRDVLGGSELRVIFTVDKSNPELVALVENGTVDQVSVNVLAKQLNCSECGFDFLGEDSNHEHLWSGTCANGHTMGQNGAHVKMNGLDVWGELSLVGLGGAQGARIVGRDRQVFKDHRLTAQGMDVLFLAANISTSDLEDFEMDIAKLIDDLTTSKANHLQLTADLSAKSAELTALTAKLTDAQTEIETLKAAIASPTGPSQADYDAALSALSDVAKKVLVATGEVDPKLEGKTVAELMEVITTKSQALVAALSAGGKAVGSDADAEKSDKLVRLAAY